MMDYHAIIERVYDHLEDDQVDKAVMGCLRIARGRKDFLSAAMFLREMNPNNEEFLRVLLNDTRHLKEEAQKYIHESSIKRWARSRQLDEDIGHALGQRGDETISTVSIFEVQKEIDLWTRMLATQEPSPQGVDPYDAAAFIEREREHRAMIRLKVRILEIVKGRVRTNCLNYAIQVERQLQAESKSVGFLHECQNEVNNYFKDRSEDVYKKLLKAAELIDSTDPEDMSLLLTQVRRAMHAVADYLFPPKEGEVICADGKKRILGNDQYLNRINEYLSVTFRKSASKDLLEAEFNHLSVFIRRLNELASKGVHSEVAAHEAKQGLIGLYMFLFNVVTRLQRDEPAP